MAFSFKDSLAQRAVKAAKHDPRWEKTVKAVHKLPQTVNVDTDVPDGLSYGSYNKEMAPHKWEQDPNWDPKVLKVGKTSDEIEGPPYVIHDVRVEKSPHGLTSTLGHELTHVLHEDALSRGDRKAISLERNTAPYENWSEAYGNTAEEHIARLGQDPTIDPAKHVETPRYISRLRKVLRNVREGDLNPVRDQRQIDQVPGEPYGPEESKWAKQYLMRPGKPYPETLLGPQPVDEPKIVRLARFLFE